LRIRRVTSSTWLLYIHAHMCTYLFHTSCSLFQKQIGREYSQNIGRSFACELSPMGLRIECHAMGTMSPWSSSHMVLPSAAGLEVEFFGDLSGIRFVESGLCVCRRCSCSCQPLLKCTARSQTAGFPAPRACCGLPQRVDALRSTLWPNCCWRACHSPLAFAPLRTWDARLARARRSPRGPESCSFPRPALLL
jgi:hypothetical protein